MEMTKNGLRYDVYPDQAVVLGFSKNTQLGGTLKIPHSVYCKPVTKIADEAFTGSSIEYVQIPTTLKVIGCRAFSRCKSLKRFYISAKRYLPLSMKLTIVGEAFSFCEQLEEIETTQDLNIGSYAFYKCHNLKRISADIMSLSRHAIIGCKNLSSLMFSENAMLAEESFLASNINHVRFCTNADINPEVLGFMKSNEVQMVADEESPLLELAYEGYQIF